jgi:hypothetical protein
MREKVLKHRGRLSFLSANFHVILPKRNYIKKGFIYLPFLPKAEKKSPGVCPVSKPEVSVEPV